jgi:hypothetical protein
LKKTRSADDGRIGKIKARLYRDDDDDVHASTAESLGPAQYYTMCVGAKMIKYVIASRCQRAPVSCASHNSRNNNIRKKEIPLQYQKLGVLTGF